METEESYANCELRMMEDMSSGTSSEDEYEDTMSRTSLLKSWGKVGQAGWSIFLKDWELAQVALSCHLAPDFLCQEMQEAW